MLSADSQAGPACKDLASLSGVSVVKGVPTGMGRSSSETALFSSFTGGVWGRVITVLVRQSHC